MIERKVLNSSEFRCLEWHRVERYGVERPEGDDEDYLALDFDCFTESDVSFEHLEARLLRFHDLIYRAFRWSLKDELLNSFELQG